MHTVSTKSSQPQEHALRSETAEFSGSVCCFTFSQSSERRVRLSASRPDLVLSTSPCSRSRPNNLEPYSYKPRSVQSYSDCLRASIDRRVCVNSSILAIVIARMRYLYLHIIFIFIYNIYIYMYSYLQRVGYVPRNAPSATTRTGAIQTREHSVQQTLAPSHPASAVGSRLCSAFLSLLR